MLRIRLSRKGARKRPFYHLVVTDSRSPRDSKYIEKVGRYNPLLPKGDAEHVFLLEDRIKHWLGHGAQPSDRVHRFLADAGLYKPRTFAEQTKKSKPHAKTLERIKAREEKVQLAATSKEEEAKAAAAATATEAATEAKEAATEAATEAKEAATEAAAEAKEAATEAATEAKEAATEAAAEAKEAATEAAAEAKEAATEAAAEAKEAATEAAETAATKAPETAT